MKAKEIFLTHIVSVEGGYVNDPSDSGGETNWGITKAVAQRAGYSGDMRDMSKEEAQGIYIKLFWCKLNLDIIELFSPEVALELADTGVNMGTSRAGEFLQRCLNVLNNRGAYYDDLKVDGDVGPATVQALEAFRAKRGKEGMKVLHKMLNCLQGAFYVELCERREKDEKFIYGWINNRVEL